MKAISIGASAYNPPLALLNRYGDMPMASLPKKLRKLIRRLGGLLADWDRFHPEERRLLLDQQVFQRSRNHMKAEQEAFDLEVRRWELQAYRRACELSPSGPWPGPRQKREELARIDAELAALDRVPAADEQQFGTVGELSTATVKVAPRAVADSAPAPNPVKPVPRHQAQENRLLEVLAELRIDPGALPRPSRRGMHSPAKQAAREKLKWSADVFDKAWKRLRKGPEPRIKDATR